MSKTVKTTTTTSAAARPQARGRSRSRGRGPRVAQASPSPRRPMLQPARKLRYSLPRAPSMNLSTQVTPTFRPMTFHHREYVGTVTANSNTIIKSYVINPGCSYTFPWLSSLAKGFNHYDFSSVAFEFVPSLSTIESGTVYSAFEYSPHDEPYTSVIEMMKAAGSMQTQIFMPHKNMLVRSRVLTPQNKQRNILLKDPDEITLAEEPSVLARFTIAALYPKALAPSNAGIGSLYVSYDVTLMLPQERRPESTMSEVVGQATFEDKPHSEQTGTTLQPTALLTSAIVKDRVSLAKVLKQLVTRTDLFQYIFTAMTDLASWYYLSPTPRTGTLLMPNPDPGPKAVIASPFVPSEVDPPLEYHAFIPRRAGMRVLVSVIADGRVDAEDPTGVAALAIAYSSNLSQIILAVNQEFTTTSTRQWTDSADDTWIRSTWEGQFQCMDDLPCWFTVAWTKVTVSLGGCSFRLTEYPTSSDRSAAY